MDVENLLPHWAEGIIHNQSWCLNAQLSTRDGRRTGNAVIVKVGSLSCSVSGEHPVYDVVTDAGNTMTLLTSELAELFWPPLFTMKAEEVLERYVNPYAEEKA